MHKNESHQSQMLNHVYDKHQFRPYEYNSLSHKNREKGKRYRVKLLKNFFTSNPFWVD